MTLPLQRILHVVGRMDRAGAETMLMNIYREIDRNRFQFDFVYFTPSRCDYDKEIEVLGGRIYRIVAPDPASRALALHALLRKGSWRTVHSHTLFSSALHLAAARLAGVPHRIAHSHSTQDANSATFKGRMYQRYARWLLARVSTRQVACGTAAGAYLFPSRGNVVLIPNAVDIDRFIQASGVLVRLELGLEQHETVIIQVGRLMPVKNQARSIAIACGLRQAGISFKLLLVGAGTEQRRIEELIRAHALQDHVRMLGLRSDIPELMASADVMLMPSLYEGFPVTLVEAQAAGLPAVVSNAVSAEVDLGLGTVQFVDLRAPDEEWVDAIKMAASKAALAAPERFEALEAAGFSSRASAARFCELYKTA